MNKTKGVKIEFTKDVCRLYYDGEFVDESNDVDYILQLAEQKRNHNSNIVTNNKKIAMLW